MTHTDKQESPANAKVKVTGPETRQQCMYEGPLRTNVKSVKTSILVRKVIQGHCFRCQSKRHPLP